MTPVHKSHSTVDVSDVSMTKDLLCRFCDLADGELHRVCPGLADRLTRLRKERERLDREIRSLLLT